MQLRSILLSTGFLAFALAGSCPFGYDSAGPNIQPNDRAMLLEALKQNPGAAAELLDAYRQKGVVPTPGELKPRMKEGRADMGSFLEAAQAYYEQYGPR